ncbi:MAG: EAL domain-containing protein [Spirochaetales bacterium]|nr:EAL domain-containing protein [Spirochaetales bacterium]
MKPAYKILLAEKSYNQALEIQKLLTYNDHFDSDITYTSQYEEVISLLKKIQFDILLLDVRISDINPDEVINEIKEISSTISIITLISDSDEELGIETIHLGAQDYLVKTRLDEETLSHSIVFSFKRNNLIKQIRQGKLREQHIRFILELSFRSYSLSKLMRQALDLIISVLPGSPAIRACIFIAKENIDKFLLVAHRGFTDEMVESFSELPLTSCICGEPAKNNYLSYHNEKAGTGEHCRVPVLYNKKLLGTIIIIHKKKALEKPGFQKFLMSVADSLAEVIESKQTTRRLTTLAFFDTLTGLPNRNQFCYRLKHILSNARRYSYNFALLFLDLDRFKSINDSLGHHAGDLLLKETAKRLKTTVRESDIVARLSGDEFAIILSRIRHEQEAALVARKVCQNMNKPFFVSDNECIISASAGIAVFPSDGEYMNKLLVNADTAMYYVKKHGKAHFHFYNPEMNAEAEEYAKIETSLYQALNQEELVLYFQPEISVRTHDIVGVESLLRWKHPKKGIIYPGDFLGIAEKTGLIGQVNEWVLQKVIEHIFHWQKLKLPPVRVSLNISGHVLLQKEQLEKIIGILKRNDIHIPMDYIEIEISENYLINHREHVVKGIKEISSLGLRFSINDFGSEYCSLKYLHDLPLYKLKIDKSFIRNLDTENKSYSLVKSIISMGHSFGLKVIAEGVERKEQFDILEALECDEVQGFLLSKPMPEDEFIRYLQEKRTG